MSKQLTVDQDVRWKPLDGSSSALPSGVTLQLDTGLGDRWWPSCSFQAVMVLEEICVIWDQLGYTSRAVTAPRLCRSAASRGPRAASAIFFSFYNQDEAPGFGPGTCSAPLCQSSGLCLIPTLSHWCQVKLLKPPSDLCFSNEVLGPPWCWVGERGRTLKVFFFFLDVWFGGLERWFSC